MRIFLIPAALILLSVGACIQKENSDDVRYVVPVFGKYGGEIREQPLYKTTTAQDWQKCSEARTVHMVNLLANLPGGSGNIGSGVRAGVQVRDTAQARLEVERTCKALQWGLLPVGTELELLDARYCEFMSDIPEEVWLADPDPMSKVRVLAGPLEGRTGCVAGNALSSTKPSN